MMEIVMDKTTKKQKMLYIKNLRKNGFRKLSKDKNGKITNLLK